MNLQQQEQFYQMMTRIKANSRAASLSTREAEIRVSEMDSNGVMISKPLKKVEEITEAKQTTTTNEPKVWNLTRNGPVLEQQQESKAASVPGINKMKAIHDFIRSNGKH